MLKLSHLAALASRRPRRIQPGGVGAKWAYILDDISPYFKVANDNREYIF